MYETRTNRREQIMLKTTDENDKFHVFKERKNKESDFYEFEPYDRILATWLYKFIT